MDLSKLVNDYYETWKTGAGYLWREGMAQLSPLIQANPDAYTGQVTSFLYTLRGVESNLSRARVAVAKLPQSALDPKLADLYARCEAQYKLLGSDFYSDTRPAPAGASLGFAPIMIVGLFFIGLTAATIGVAGYQYATNLREQTALAAKELEARVMLAQQGLSLPGSTLKPQADPFQEIGETVGTVFKVGALGLLIWGGLKVVQKS